MEKKVTTDNLNNLADLFKVLGDPTRVKILFALFKKSLNVSELASQLEMTPSAISHQLKTLKQAKLVKNKREGKTVFYSLDDDHVYTIFNQGLSHVLEDS